MKPVVFIFGLMRTGTTLLQELLTYPPDSFIFHEPWFHRDKFLLKEVSRKILREDFDVRISSFVKEGFPWEKREMDYLDCCREEIPQVGVKEIRLAGWQNYRNAFDDWRIVLILRDPRDIYLSCHNRLKLGNAWVPHFPPFTPENLVRELEPDVNAHEQMLMPRWKNDQSRVFEVAYEDLCRDSNIIEEIKEFIDSPIPKDQVGQPGEFHKLIERGTYELNLHEGGVTTYSVNRYDNLPDDGYNDYSELKYQAEKFYRLMGKYRKMWEAARRVR